MNRTIVSFEPPETKVSEWQMTKTTRLYLYHDLKMVLTPLSGESSTYGLNLQLFLSSYKPSKRPGGKFERVRETLREVARRVEAGGYGWVDVGSMNYSRDRSTMLGRLYRSSPDDEEPMPIDLARVVGIERQRLKTVLDRIADTWNADGVFDYDRSTTIWNMYEFISPHLRQAARNDRRPYVELFYSSLEQDLTVTVAGTAGWARNSLCAPLRILMEAFGQNEKRGDGSAWMVPTILRDPVLEWRRRFAHDNVFRSLMNLPVDRDPKDAFHP